MITAAAGLNGATVITVISMVSIPILAILMVVVILTVVAIRAISDSMVISCSWAGCDSDVVLFSIAELIDM